jgi:hypothetical protein
MLVTSPGRLLRVRRWGFVAVGDGRSEDQDDDHQHHDHGSEGDRDGEDRVEQDENGSGGNDGVDAASGPGEIETSERLGRSSPVSFGGAHLERHWWLVGAVVVE